MRVRRGRLVTIEGGEGAGKSSVLAELRAALAAAGHEVVVTREPGGTPTAEAIRALMLDPAHAGMAAEAELLLAFAARAQHVHECVLPALARGATVLSDRFTDASFAYQGAGRGIPTQRIAELERWAARVRPDLTLLLDVGVAQGLERARSRGGEPDRIEREQDGFFERVRGAYLARAAAEPARFRVIDATRPQAEVAAAVRAVLHAWLGEA
ncbi:dTMP kinase [Coralloluteibacterium stylophorae]|uniref:Thymidylate kinase n=1 Tax=Coralloluteibacterium stylophorae TaxID=1776034 RepID=A0A8J8AYZ1_9GAMM|nr:dTMP kinase [Coralloluteibacterium stylophorae]MBS7457625.1 dTMP kinase [Coralloluteibacterium stylophorae]